ncbi:MAG: tripartite tricarboxylate transporter substrate binding protein [Ramlibacter sp.]
MHSHIISRRQLLQAAGALAAFGTHAVHGQTSPAFQPTKPVKLIIPQPPGGAADRLARGFAERLEALWKQPVVIENKPGGGVVVGTLAVARAAPDGHTIALLGSSMSINAVQRKDLPYDTLKDLTPIARVGYYTVALVAGGNFPAIDVKSLITLAKAQPGKLSFGSNGIGTSAHLAGEMLNHMGGVEIQHVPYNGAAKMYTDMVGGQIPLGFSILSSAENFIKAGQLKVLGVTTSKRSTLYPQYPAIAETLPGYDAVNWAGFCGPASMPADMAKRIGEDILAVLRAPDMAKSVADQGIEMGPQGPAEFDAFIRDEIKRFSTITRPLGTRMQ